VTVVQVSEDREQRRKSRKRAAQTVALRTRRAPPTGILDPPGGVAPNRRTLNTFEHDTAKEAGVGAEAASIGPALEAFRQRAATALLGILAVGGVVLVTLYLPAMLAAQAYGVVTMALGLVGTSVVMAWRSDWPLTVRVGWIVFNLWLAAVPGVFTGGDRGVYAANFIGSVVTAAILLGWRPAMLVVGAVIAIFAGAAWGHAVGVFPLGAVARLELDSVLGWAGLGLTVVQIASLAVVGSWLMYEQFGGLVAELRRTVALREKALAELTDSRHARETLAGTLEHTLAAVNTGLFEVDLVSGAMTCAGEMRRLLGCRPGIDEPSLAALRARTHPEDRARLDEVLRSEQGTLEFRVQLPDGAQRWLRTTVSSVPDQDGAPHRVRGLVLDVTTERANELQRKRLAEVASRTGNPVVITDLEGRIEWVNDTFVRLTGWTLDEIEGRRPGDFLQAPQTDPEARARMARAIAAREPFDCEVLNVAKNGRQYWVHVEARVVHDEAGQPSGFVAVQTDITERRLAARRDSLAERVAALLLGSDTVAEAGGRLVRELITELDVRTAQFWLVESGNPHLRYVAGASADSAGEPGHAFLEISRQLPFGPGRDFVLGVGVPGTAWGTRATAVLPVMESVGSRRLAEAKAAGVISFCGVPVRGPDGILAVLEVGGTAYFPGHELLPNLLERVAEQVAAFLLHDASRRAFQDLFDRSPDGLLVVGEDGVVTDANARAAALFGGPLRKTLDALLAEGGALVTELLEKTAESSAQGQLLRRSAQGASGPFAAEVSASRVVTANRRGAIIAVRDLTERDRVESALTRSLREKEMLLQEVHHRVKNNLQIVSSLLSMQADGMEPGAPRDSLLETVYRVRSMSFVHQQLYSSDRFDSIDFGAYAQSLSAALLSSLDPRTTIEHDVEPIEVPLDLAVPCGLVLNELVTNAIKHGRSADGTCAIRIALHRDGEAVVLTVSDRGPGFPADKARSGSLGMQLIRALARQLGAKLEFASEGGARVTLRMTRLGENRDAA
jgi:PAS domain S-box-containing protein